eukprot:555655_1
MDMRISVYRKIFYRNDDYESQIYKCFWNILDCVIFYPLECIGRNALGIYILAESGIVKWFFKMFYWHSKKNCLANLFWPTGEIWGPSHDNVSKHPWLYSPVMMVWVLSYCIFWTLCAIYFHKHKMYWVV